MLKKILHYFIPQAYMYDAEELRRASLTVGAFLIIAYFNINYIVISNLIDYKGGIYSQAPLLLASVLCLFLYRQAIKPWIINVFYFFCCIISIGITIYYTRGYESFILPWIATTPIVALLVAGKRGGIFALIGSIISLTFFYYLYHHQIPIPEEDYNLEYKNVFSYTTHLGLVLILFAVALFFENAKNTALKTLDYRNEQLKLEKKRSDDLLLNILPSEIVAELKETGESKAKLFNNVSVLFTDFVHFTNICETMSPEDLVSELDVYFKEFDEIIERNGLEKIKTIGDAYLAVCGLPNEVDDHAYKTVQAGLDIVRFVEKQKAQGGKFDVRVGINSGPLIAGIVGVKKFAYDVWGDTVNTASRLESTSESGKVNISESTYQLVHHLFDCTFRGKVEAKSKGEIAMYFVEPKAK